MTGQGAAEAAPRNPSGRRAQLQAMQALQRRLNDIKSCNCPDDCRAEGRDGTQEQEDNNKNNNGSGENNPQNPSNNAGGNATDNPGGAPSGPGPSGTAPGPSGTAPGPSGTAPGPSSAGPGPTSAGPGGPGPSGTPQDTSLVSQGNQSGDNTINTSVNTTGTSAFAGLNIQSGPRDDSFGTPPNPSSSSVTGSNAGGNTGGSTGGLLTVVGGPRDDPFSKLLSTPQNTKSGNFFGPGPGSTPNWFGMSSAPAVFPPPRGNNS